jgi:PAS domain S-box-containing protein
MKISQKLLILFLLNALLPVVAVASFSYFNTQKALRNQINTGINNTATRQAARIKALYESNLDTLGLFPTLISVNQAMVDYVASPTQANQDKLNLTLNDTHRFDTGYRRLNVLDLNGVVIGSTNRSAIGKNFKNTPMFTKGQTYGDITQFFKDTDGKLAHYAFSPILWGNKVIGYALLEAPVEDYFLVTQDYTDLGATGETLLLGSTSSGKYEYLTPGRFNGDIALKPYEATPGHDYRNRSVLSVQRDITGTPWRIIVKMDQDEVFRSLYQLRDLAIALSAAATVIIVVLGLYFSRRITNPIRRFTEIVKRIQSGAYDLRVPVASRDEIGTLGLAFNNMTNQLAESNHQLEIKVADRTRTLDQKVKELGDAKAKDDAILDSIGDGMLVTDKSGNILLVNAIAADFLGVDTAKVLQTSVANIPLYDEMGKPLPLEEQPMTIALQTARKIEVRVGSMNVEGAKMALAVTATPVLEQGTVIGVIQTIRDVTKEREVDRMKTEFISLASHQLRTPLSAIKWFSEMLINGDAGEMSKEQSEFASNIGASAERMIDLVNSLLNISRIESGRIIVEPRPTDLTELVNGVVSDLKGKTEAKKQTIIVSVHDGLPKVNLDPQLISQVYMNFLTNAIKYTPQGGEISVFVSRKDQDIVSQITDNGYGIPKQQQDRVFQKFFRAENIVKFETDGTGLGLYLVKAIIESSGGRVWFKSEVNKGTTFWFTIPMSGMKAKAGEVTLNS